MPLKINMNGNSRLAKQYRFAESAIDLAERLELGTRIHLTRHYVTSPRGHTDALGRVLAGAGFKGEPGHGGRIDHFSQYLGVDAGRLPPGVRDALWDLGLANDAYSTPGQRRQEIAKVLRTLASRVKNARIGR